MMATSSGYHMFKHFSSKSSDITSKLVNLILSTLPYIMRVTIFISGFMLAQVNLLIKQVLNIKYDTGTLVLKEFLSIQASSMCIVFEYPLP